MPRAHLIKQSDIVRTSRVMQLEGMFDVIPSVKSEEQWEINLPIEDKEWNVGLIVGPSGSGKTTIAKDLFGDYLVKSFEWDGRKSIMDSFPQSMSIKEITMLLSSVGFSSPPLWLRPFQVLSNGEQFRVTMARALAEAMPITVIDEFTSVIDRTVAQIGSAAISKTVKRRNQKFVALSCHYDIVEWLEPDWIYQPHLNVFENTRGVLRRPEIEITIRRVYSNAWRIFKKYHYLDSNLHRASKCFVGFIQKQPAVFTAVLPFPHARRSGWREHRTVCLPDFQGCGVGNAMSEYIASLFVATRKPYFSTTSNPAMIQHRNRSNKWKLLRATGRAGRAGRTGMIKKVSSNRFTAGFEYVGQSNLEDAREFKVV